MSDLLEKCSVCSALVDEEDLFCSNCGTEAPHERQRDATSQSMAAHSFECQGCGASMSYDASAQNLRCPFCSSERLDKRKVKKALAPQAVIPLQVHQGQAERIMRQWLGSSFWRPSDLAQSAAVTRMTPVYVPYWVFEATTYTYWTADTSQTPAGARGDWYPLAGEHRGRYAGLLVGASGALTPQETSAICPFQLAAAVSPQEIDLDNAIVEQFRVHRKYARPLARQGLETLETNACMKYVPGRCRNMKVNTRLQGLSSRPILLPVWIMAYQYKGKLYRFLLNGQTGKCTGEAPTSLLKIVLLVLGVVCGLILLLALLGLATR